MSKVKVITREVKEDDLLLIWDNLYNYKKNF